MTGLDGSPGSRSFIYNRMQRLRRRHARREEREIKSRAYLHAIGSNPEHDKAVFGFGLSPLVKVEPADIPVVATFPDVPFAFGTVEHGSQNEIDDIRKRPFDSVGNAKHALAQGFCAVDDAVTNMAVRGDDLSAVDSQGCLALRSRFTLISLIPTSSMRTWLCPASEAVVTNLAAAQDALYVQLRDGAVERLFCESALKGVRNRNESCCRMMAQLASTRQTCARRALSLNSPHGTKANRFYETRSENKKCRGHKTAGPPPSG